MYYDSIKARLYYDVPNENNLSGSSENEVFGNVNESFKICNAKKSSVIRKIVVTIMTLFKINLISSSIVI